MTALKWITNEAKALKRKYPKRFSRWTDYVKQASAIYASKHGGKSPVGKKHKKLSGMSKRKKARRSSAVRAIKKAHRTEGKAIRRLGTIGATKRKLKNQIEKKLGEEYVKRDNSKLKRLKKKIGKKISQLKRELNFLKK